MSSATGLPMRAAGCLTGGFLLTTRQRNRLCRERVEGEDNVRRDASKRHCPREGDPNDFEVITPHCVGDDGLSAAARTSGDCQMRVELSLGNDLQEHHWATQTRMLVWMRWAYRRRPWTR